jgi:Rieske Fe-S protein
VKEDRRRLCQAGALIAVGAALPACGSSPKSCTPPDGGYACGTGGVSLGINATDVAPMSAMKLELQTQHLWLCRDKGGIYAMSAECTHLGCDAEIVDPANVSKGFLCPCHGATYAFDGSHPTAPAPSALQHFLVCATVSGVLVVDLAQPVDPCTRYVV